MTSCLVDSNVMVRLLYAPDLLGKPVRDALESSEGRHFYSIVSLWELLLKIHKGKLEFDIGEFETFTKEAAWQELVPTREDYLLSAVLPRHHNDPFDRLIIAQAMAAGLTVLTSDWVFSDYAVNVVRG
jgi:PIN domain nuclease of toxin-antitoxin system